MPFSTLPSDVLLVSLLPILQARLEKQDLFHLSLVSRELSSLLRPLLFQSLTFKAGEALAFERVSGLASSPHLASLVKTVRFESIKQEEKEAQPEWNLWTSILPLLSHLTSLHTVVCIGKVPPGNFWRLLDGLANVNPKVIEITDGFMVEKGPPPSFFLLSGLERMRFDGDDGSHDVYKGKSPSVQVGEMVFRNWETIQELEVHSKALHLNKVLIPFDDPLDFPSFPALTSLVVQANVSGVEYWSKPHDKLKSWFHDLLPHLPKLESLLVHTGVEALRAHNYEPYLMPGGVMSYISSMLMPVVMFSKDDPLTETTLLPLLLDKEAIEGMQSLKRLVLARPPSLVSPPEYEWVPLGRKDASVLFEAVAGLKSLEELSVTFGEIGVDLLEGMVSSVAGLGLKSLEIDLRVLAKEEKEEENDDEEVEAKKEDDAFEEDGLLWSSELPILASTLAPLASTLAKLVVSDNRRTRDRSSLFDPTHPSHREDTFDFLPSLLLFSRHLPHLTSVRWITRDGEATDALLRDQLWVATTEGGWMRLVG